MTPTEISNRTRMLNTEAKKAGGYVSVTINTYPTLNPSPLRGVVSLYSDITISKDAEFFSDTWEDLLDRMATKVAGLADATRAGRVHSMAVDVLEALFNGVDLDGMRDAILHKHSQLDVDAILPDAIIRARLIASAVPDA